jgi:hypothetical protein
MDLELDDEDELEGEDEEWVPTVRLNNGLEVDVFLALDDEGKGVDLDELHKARWMLCGNKQVGFYQVDVHSGIWASYVYH